MITPLQPRFQSVGNYLVVAVLVCMIAGCSRTQGRATGSWASKAADALASGDCIEAIRILDAVELPGRLEIWYLSYVDSAMSCYSQHGAAEYRVKGETAAREGEQAFPESAMIRLWHARLIQQTGTSAALAEQIASTRELAERCRVSVAPPKREQCEAVLTMLSSLETGRLTVP